jgi:hypothetical protein
MGMLQEAKKCFLEHGGFTIRQQGTFECVAWFEAVKNELADSCGG